MTTSKTATSARLLSQVTGERQTGALVVGGHPGGAVYVLEGRVIYAESPACPGVGELLTSSGRLAARTWQNALDRSTSTAQVGRTLVEQGHLTQGELELCTLSASYDAAYFTLAPANAPAEFLTGATHWLGAVVHIDAAAITREVRRRIKLLHEIFPDPRVDTAAVAPAPRAPRERFALTAMQWELLVHADGQRTPADLAQLLGKAGFAVVQELRHLAAAGLLQLPEVRAEKPDFVRMPRARGTATPAERSEGRSEARPVDAAPVAVISGSAPVAVAVETAPPAPSSGDPPRHALAEDGTANPAAYRPPRLTRRKPGAKLPKDLAGEPPPVHPGTDEVLLKRIRTALRALR